MNDPAAGPRIAPLPPREWPQAMREALAPLTPPTPRPLDAPKGINVLGTFAHYPALASAWHLFNRHVLYSSTLTARERELLVLRVAHLRACEYEWRQHVYAATDAGLTRDEIAHVRVGASADGWSPIDAALLTSADELIAAAEISDSTWAALAGEYSEQQILDVVFTVGCYDVVAMMMRSCRLQLDDDLQQPMA